MYDINTLRRYRHIACAFIYTVAQVINSLQFFFTFLENSTSYSKLLTLTSIASNTPADYSDGVGAGKGPAGF